jgi:hypothetical protein
MAPPHAHALATEFADWLVELVLPHLKTLLNPDRGG